MSEFDNAPQGSKLDAVRELIFGQNLKEYDKELQDLHRRISQNREQISNDMSALKAQFQQNLASLEENIMNRIRAVREATQEELRRQDQAHVSKENLGKLLSDFAKNL